MNQLTDDIETAPHDMQATLFRHWSAIKAEGITASQFIAFLQPLADLDGITVSYLCEEERPHERAPGFALDEDGRIRIGSKPVEPEDLVGDQ